MHGPSFSALPTSLPACAFYIEASKTPALKKLEKQLYLYKAELNLLEQWQLHHYTKTGFLGWIARFILNLWPHSKVRFLQIEDVQRQLNRLISKSERKLADTPFSTISPPQATSEPVNLKTATQRASVANSLSERKTRSAPANLLKEREKTSRVALPIPTISPPRVASEPVNLKTATQRASVAYLLSEKKARRTSANLLKEREQASPVALPIDSAVYQADKFEEKKKSLLKLLSTKKTIPSQIENKLLADKDIMLAVVKLNGNYLCLASQSLKSDKEIVLAALKQNVTSLQFADPQLKSDKEFMLAVLAQNGMALEYTSGQIKADKEVILAAVQQDGLALKWASAKLQCDKEVILAAIFQNSGAIEYVSLKFPFLSEVKELLAVAG